MVTIVFGNLLTCGKKQICGILINSFDALLVQRGLHKTMEYECTKPHKNQSAIPVNSDD